MAHKILRMKLPVLVELPLAEHFLEKVPGDVLVSFLLAG
jgi:hypothetical protein